LDDRQKAAAATATANLMDSEELDATQDKLYNKIKGQDALVEDLYNYFHQDENIKVDAKVNDKATIIKADGTTEDTTQTAIASSVAFSIA
jgi:hypothetical protein